MLSCNQDAVQKKISGVCVNELQLQGVGGLFFFLI